MCICPTIERIVLTKLLFIDMETTGLSPKKHAPVEVGAIWTDDRLKILANGQATYHAYIKPFKGARIEKTAMAVNHIDLRSKEFKAKSKLPDIVVRHLQKLTDTYCGSEVPILTGWNVSFDVGFLRGMYERYKGHPPIEWLFPHRTIDVQPINAFMQGFRIESLSAQGGVRHTSTDDIEITLERLRELLRQRDSLRSLIVRKLNYGKTS